MVESTRQMTIWQGTFGREYTDRHAFSVADLDALYQRNYGVTRTEMNQAFLGTLERSLRILEVGANRGVQLACLKAMGFSSLYGIELQAYAVEQGKTTAPGLNLIQGSAFDLPFKDRFFDLVFTSGLLIHVAPDDLPAVMTEIDRCSARYIWGFEYFADKTTELNYRGREGLLWKSDFAGIYRASLPHLACVKQERYKYLNGDNVDAMFLLEK